MTILDKYLEFDPTGTAITVTADSTNRLDLGANRDLGVDGQVLDVLVQIVTALTGGTSIVVAIQGAPDNGSGAEGTYVDLVKTPAIVAARLTAGRELLRVPLPMLQDAGANSNVPYRFLKLVYTIVGTFSAGTIYAGLIPHTGRQNNYSYTSGFTVTN
jgi:hypothetical protein